MRIPKINERVMNPIWSIAIYTGESLFDLADSKSARPVLEAKHVTDMDAEFIADPFMVHVGNEWSMYFEVMNRSNGKGSIGLATSLDGLKWVYKGIVIREPFHMSYPHVFEWNGEYFMIPETCEANAIRLYKAKRMPDQWAYVGDLIHGYYADNTLLQYKGKLWIFSETEQSLKLFVADEIQGPWQEHPASPIVRQNENISRPAGRVISSEGRLFRFTQDSEPYYGKQIRAFEITTLTPETYEEIPTSLEWTGTGSKGDWNADGMHHIDAHQIGPNRWIACVDGHRFERRNVYLKKAEQIGKMWANKLFGNKFTKRKRSLDT
jgi:hypothetical protein